MPDPAATVPTGDPTTTPEAVPPPPEVSRPDGAPPKVLILGGGFAGIGAARKLRKAPVEVTLVDRHDYHTFQPLLYQVATDVLDSETVGHPIREYVDKQHNLHFAMAKVTGIDLDRRQVTFADWDPQDYDYLVVALGARVNFHGTPGAQEHSFPLYTLNDAIRLKQHILRRFEEAAKASLSETLHALDIVVVGGGPTGVETAGAMADLIHYTLAHDDPDHPVGNTRVTIVEHGDRLLAMFDPSLSEYTREELESRGVIVRLGEDVRSIDSEFVTLGSGEVLPSIATVWGAGLEANPLAEALGVDLERGRIPVGPLLNLTSHPEVFVVGDIAAIAGHDGATLPQLGSVALQSGEHVGKTIDRVLRKHKEPKAFSYLDKGTMATIGRRAAVAVIPPGEHLTGRPAWVMWGAVHLALLSGGDSRMQALSNWFWAFTRHDRPSRVIVDPEDDD